MRRIWWVLAMALILSGCAPTLEHQKASAQDVQTETATQAHLAAQLRLKRVQQLGRVANRMRAATNNYCLSLETKKSGCSFPVMLSDAQGLNAHADGNRVYIDAGMMRFVESDDELAYVVGHELAHNVLEHSDKKRGNALLGGVVDVLLTAATGVSTDGAFSKAGAGAYSQAFESEADYLGMYIAAQSGYDISMGPTFWRKMAVESPGSILQNYNSTHPSSPERFVALSQTIDEIQTKYDMGLALIPNRADGTGAEPVALGSSESQSPVGLVARTALAEETKHKAVVPGPRSYSIGKAALADGCSGAGGFAPQVSMVEQRASVEVYEAYCHGAATIRYRCEWQDCRVVEQ